GGSASSQADNSAACTQQAPGQTKKTEDVFKDEKVSGNLVRLYSILAGVPNYGTPADLGTEPQLIAASANDKSKTGRLMLCSGQNNTPEQLDLTWRVIIGTQLLKADKSTPLDKDSINSELNEYINKATEKTKSSQ